MELFYDDILGKDNEEDNNGYSFSFTSNFRIIDDKNGFYVEFHKLFKRSFKGYEKEMETISKTPLDIKDVYNIELDEFRMNKLYKGIFHVDFYDNKKFDIFLKDYNII